MRVKKKWWGVTVMLNKSETCFLTSGSLGLSFIAAAVGGWGWLVAGAIFFHKMWIHNKVGTRGVRLHINWSGTLHKVVRRGSDSSCPPVA